MEKGQMGGLSHDECDEPKEDHANPGNAARHA